MLSRSLLYEAVEATSVVIGLRRGHKSVPAIITANTGMSNPSHTSNSLTKPSAELGCAFRTQSKSGYDQGYSERNLARTLSLLLNLVAVASFDFS
jgi:hypothetical protein